MDPQASKIDRGGASALPLLLAPENGRTAHSDSAGALAGNSCITLPLVIAEWQKNSREVIRVSLSNYERRTVIDLRTWFTAVDGELRPGPKGLTTEIRHLPELAKGIVEAAGSHPTLEAVGEKYWTSH
jgi:Transcriptional Coactivator p15 (PC4)